jgi:regulatory protein
LRCVRQTTYDKMQKTMKLTDKEALNKAAALCSTAERCRMDIMRSLEKWGIEEDDKQRIIKQLIEEKYIDEKRFCHAFVNDKFRFDKWGRKKMAQALAMKQIPSDVVEEELAEINEEEYLETLRTLINAKRRSVKAKSAYELWGKLMRFGVSRGFEAELVNKCLKSGGIDEGD